MLHENFSHKIYPTLTTNSLHLCEPPALVTLESICNSTVLLVSGAGRLGTVIQCFSHANYPASHHHHQVLLVSVPADLSVQIPPERRLYAGVDNFPRENQSVFILGCVVMTAGLRCARHVCN